MMSLYNINENEKGKQSKKLKKVISLPPVRSNLVLEKRVNGSSISGNKKHGDMDDSRGHYEGRLSPCSTNGHMGDGKLPSYHYLMEQVFENFLLRLDDIFLTLRNKECLQTDLSHNLKGYHDICGKLRMEILIAMDKLELMSLPNSCRTEGSSEFLEKMCMLKSQLSELRWQYHNAIKELGQKMI